MQNNNCFPILSITITDFVAIVWYFAGLLLITIALCADAIIGNIQEKTMKLHNASNPEMVCRQKHIF